MRRSFGVKQRVRMCRRRPSIRSIISRVASPGLMLVYGARDVSDAKGVVLGHLICTILALLAQHGIATDWNGDIRGGIGINPFA